MSSLVFPTLPGLDITVTRTPLYKTQTQESFSGKELRRSCWSYPRYSYALNFNFLRAEAAATEFQTLFGFIARHMGCFGSFLFTDPLDSAVTAHPFGVGNASTQAFQLQRSLVPSTLLPAAAARTFWPASGDGYEPVFEMATTPLIYINGVLKTLTTHYTIANGLVTFVTPPVSGAVLTWTGTYYRRVRLAGEAQEAEQLFYQVWSSKSLKLLSVK